MKFSDLQYPSKIWPLVNRRGAARHPGALHPEAPRQLEQDVFIPPSLLGTRRLVARRRTFLLVVLLTICLHSFVSSGSCFHFTFELAFPTSMATPQALLRHLLHFLCEKVSWELSITFEEFLLKGHPQIDVQFSMGTSQPASST